MLKLVSYNDTNYRRLNQVNTKQLKMLKVIMAGEQKSNINWSDIQKLMLALGAVIEEGRGSRGGFVLKNRVFHFHRPHPQKEAKQYQIQDLRKFLLELGVKYEG